MALETNNSTNPLEPGDPFKKQNFNKFSMGMMLFMVVVGALLVVLFVLFFRHHGAKPAPSSQSRLVMQVFEGLAG